MAAVGRPSKDVSSIRLGCSGVGFTVRPVVDRLSGSSYMVGTYGSSGDLRITVRLFADRAKGGNSVSGGTVSIYSGSGVRFAVRPIADRSNGKGVSSVRLGSNGVRSTVRQIEW